VIKGLLKNHVYFIPKDTIEILINSSITSNNPGTYKKKTRIQPKFQNFHDQYLFPQARWSPENTQVEFLSSNIKINYFLSQNQCRQRIFLSSTSFISQINGLKREENEIVLLNLFHLSNQRIFFFYGLLINELLCICSFFNDKTIYPIVFLLALQKSDPEVYTDEVVRVPWR